MSNSPPTFLSLYAPPPPKPPLSTGVGLTIVGVGLIVVTLTLAVKFMCKAIPAGTEPLGHTAASAAQHRRQPPLQLRDDGEQMRDASLDRPPLPGPPPILPAFAYNRPPQKKVGGACSVCLGAFEFGEMVRLLPVCLHLYHAECIDPWLRKHSTCPVCRSETDPATVIDVSQLPPV